MFRQCSKILIAAALALFVAVPSTRAEEEVFAHPIANAAAIAETLYRPQHLSGSFTQKKKIENIDAVLSSSGYFTIRNDIGIRWTVLKPFPTMITIAGEKVCMGDGKPLDTGSNQTVRHVVAVMQGLLMQDYEALGRYFDLFFMKDGDGFQIGLKTTDTIMAAVFTKMVATGRKYVEHIVLYGKEGDRTEMNFSDIVEAAEDFSCEK